ncbi:hypothetical protein EV127DRAFT_468444 [Xylaria flabelliformis]|nr:hypothetical protein EV127DRAFT_468444 [Xylaria flabelliformis]
MTATTTGQLARPRPRPRHEPSLRVQLARRTIDPRLHPDRVSKPTSSKPAKLSPRSPRSTRQHDAIVRELRARTRPLDLSPDQLRCAQAIFDKLPTIPHVASRTPRLYHRGSGKYELVDPAYAIWKMSMPGLVAYGPYIHLRKLSVERIHALLDNLLIVINKLYDAHIAYTPDIRTLRVARKRIDKTLWPFVETFDYNKRVDDQEVPWEDLKKKTVEIIKGQFCIVEQLASLEDLQPLPSFIEFQPDSVVEIFTWDFDDLNHTQVPMSEQLLIMHRVNRYSPKFGEYVHKKVGSLFERLKKRTGPADESVNGKVRDYLHIVSHTLKLLEQSLKDRQIEHDDLVTRTYLQMIYTASLIHLHAKNIWVRSSTGLLRFNELVADAYTSYEGFQSVVNAYSELKNAILCLDKQGEHIISRHYFYQREIYELRSRDERERQRLLSIERCIIEKTGIIPRGKIDGYGLLPY